MSTSDFISNLISKQGFVFKYEETFPSSEHDVYELKTWLEDKDQIKYDYQKICVRDRENPQEVAFRKLLDNIIEHYYESVSHKSDGRFVVLDDFAGMVDLMVDEDGNTIIFDSYQEAKEFAEDECQNGKVVKL